jgi:hypothetical protein
MKVDCNNDESGELCCIINKFDIHGTKKTNHRHTYIKVNHIEFSKQMTSRRAYLGAPMLQVEFNCVKVNGSDKFSTGTRYIYEGEILYTEVCRWYDNRLQKRRDTKLKELGI